jgi:hypothetical protein
MAMAPIQCMVPWWKARHAWPCGWMRLPAPASGIVMRPESVVPWPGVPAWRACISWRSWTDEAVGLTDAGCWAKAGAATMTAIATARAATRDRSEKRIGWSSLRTVRTVAAIRN